MTSFEALSIGAPILRALENLGYESPTEIQVAAIPSLMNGEDLIGVAQTGGGKTAAFVIPMLERLAAHADRPKPGMPRALILAPTRELAIQITDAIKEIGAGMPARVCTVYGGVPYRTQVHILRRGVDIIVATPGRLKDLMKQGNIYLDETEYFVLDEADRMLDMGFVDEVRDIAKKLPSGHQSVMFSATMHAKVVTLAGTILRDATQVEVARQATITDNLVHKIMFVPGHKKNDLLLQLLEDEKPSKALIFVRTRRDADQLCDYLDAVGLKVEAIHGDKKQKYRQRTINNFKIGRFDYLVATDVASRGIDVADISHVINMDVPVEAENYVHRIGRTARGKAHGRAITLCGKGDLRLLKDIEHLIKMKIDVDHNHSFPLSSNKPSSGGYKGRGRPTDGRPNGGRPSSRGPDDGPRANGHKPWEKRANKRSKTAGGEAFDAKPWKKREEQQTEKRDVKAAQKAATRKTRPIPTEEGQRAYTGGKSAGKLASKKAGKRIDASAHKRKSKAGAKKRPSVVARKAKVAQTKAFRKPTSSSTNGGNQPMRRH